MTTIKSSTTATTAYSVEADTTGALVIQTGVTPTTALTVGSDQSVTFAGAVSLSGNQTTTGNLTVNGNTTLGDASTDTILMTGAPSIGGAGLGMGMGFRNRIINGAMVIDQRNAGASVTVTGNPYTLDRWYSAASVDGKYTVQQNAGSITPPAGFTNYLGCTVGASANVTVGAGDYFGIRQAIEGYNVSDFGFGSATASTVTLSFWVRSSVTGTYGATLKNSANNRSYPFTYAISAANTWEQKSVTVAGDTTGTWLTTNGVGLYITFGLGVGATYSGTAGAWAASNLWSATGAVKLIETNSATFYITGVQLEKGSTATSFDYRPYGTELALCQRYFETSYDNGVAVSGNNGSQNYTVPAVGNAYLQVPFKLTKRASPTMKSYDLLNNADRISTPAGDNQTFFGFERTNTMTTQLTTNNIASTGRIAFSWTATAEL